MSDMQKAVENMDQTLALASELALEAAESGDLDRVNTAILRLIRDRARDLSLEAGNRTAVSDKLIANSAHIEGFKPKIVDISVDDREAI